MAGSSPTVRARSDTGEVQGFADGRSGLHKGFCVTVAPAYCNVLSLTKLGSVLTEANEVAELDKLREQLMDLVQRVFRLEQILEGGASASFTDESVHYTARCFICDSRSLSPIDLVMSVRMPCCKKQ